MKELFANIGKVLAVVALCAVLIFGIPQLMVFAFSPERNPVLTTLEVSERQAACANIGGISVVELWEAGPKIGQPRDVTCENVPVVKVFPKPTQVKKAPELPDDYITPEFLHKFAMECALNPDSAVFVGTEYDLIDGEYTRYPNFVACRKVKS